jgi:putative PEP-CTERM system histidine kinase
VAHAEGLGLGFEDPWLVVPLTHPREGLLGAVLLARPRAALVLDAEVFDLLRTLGREVAMFLAERQAAEALADQAALRTHADRFAFVAHDIKTVASQLTLLLANAEAHLANPAFQQDMLLTVRAAAERIARLIQRLRVQEAEPTAALDPLSRLRGLTGHRAAAIELIAEETSLVAMAPEAFDAAVTHLLDNAMEAAAPGSPVRLRLHQGGPSVLLDITDDGPGMSADFVRDTLFRPLATSKPRGSGIGAWQARALLRGAGGDLAVLSRPGEGTTMRLTLPRAGRA